METLVQGRIDLSFHQVAGEIVKLVLERLNSQVDVRSAPHEEAFASLRRGELDLLIGWFEGSHGKYLDDQRSSVKVLENVVYSPYCIWGVPDYVPESAVSTVEDLLKPDVQNKMRKRIQGINPGAGISRFSQEIVDEYKLSNAGYYFQSGTENDCFGEFESAYAQRDWTVVPLWHPQYLHVGYKIRALKEDKNLLRGKDKAQIVIRLSSLSKLNEVALNVLQRITLGNDAVSLMDSHVWKDGLSPSQAALRWTADNQRRIESWFLPSPYERLSAQGLELPNAPGPAGHYAPFAITSNNLIQTSLQLPWIDGKIAYKGKLSHSGSTEVSTLGNGIAAAKVCALNLLSQLHEASGHDLARVRMIRLEGHVACDDTFHESPQILDAASDLINDVLGNNGVHARTVLHVPSAPLGVPVLLGAHAELLW